MIAETIVVASTVLGVVFTLAWIARPRFRARIERPKHGLQHRLRRYDQTCSRTGGGTVDD